MNFNGHCLINSNIYISKNVINLYIFYILNPWLRSLKTDFTLKKIKLLPKAKIPATLSTEKIFVLKLCSWCRYCTVDIAMKKAGTEIDFEKGKAEVLDQNQDLIITTAGHYASFIMQVLHYAYLDL